jgi:hypothetical protein
MHTKSKRMIRCWYRISLGLAFFCAFSILISHSRGFELYTMYVHVGISATTLWFDVIQGDETDIIKAHADDQFGSYGLHYKSYNIGGNYTYFLKPDRIWPSLSQWQQKPLGLFDWIINNGPRIARNVNHTTVAMPLVFLLLIFSVQAGIARFVLPRDIPPGHCGVCRYDLTGNQSGVCPECGTAIRDVSALRLISNLGRVLVRSVRTASRRTESVGLVSPWLRR